MSRTRLTHATIMQDKSIAYGRIIKPVMRLPEIRRPVKNPPRRRIQPGVRAAPCKSCINDSCRVCHERVALVLKLDAIMLEKPDATCILSASRVTHISNLISTSAVFPDPERIARVIHTLNLSPSSPQTSALVRELYSRSVEHNGIASLHLRNVFLSHLLKFRDGITDLAALPSTASYTPQSLLKEYIHPLSRVSTVAILVKFTAFAKLTMLLQQIPIEVLRNEHIQRALCQRAFNGQPTSELQCTSLAERRVMKLMQAINTRCTLNPKIMTEFKHPHALILPNLSMKASIRACRNVEALRWIVKRGEIEREGMEEVWRVAKKFGDEIVGGWAERRMKAVKVLALKWKYVEAVARRYEENGNVGGYGDAVGSLLDEEEGESGEMASGMRIRGNEFLLAKRDLEYAMMRVKTDKDIHDAINTLDAL